MKKRTAVEDAAISGILTRDEIEAAKKKARDKVSAEKKKLAVDAVMDEEVETARREAGLIEDDPLEEIQEVTLDLGPYTDRVSLDGKIYMHGGTYKVRRAVAQVLLEQSHRSWRHQAEVDGKIGTRAADIYKPRNTVVSAKTGTHNAPRSAA